MINAVEFLKEEDRMCKTFNLCDGGGSKEMCELYAKSDKKGLTCADYISDYPDEAVAIKGVLEIKPCKLVGSKLNTEECHSYDEFGLSGCYECRKKYWNEEVE